MVKHITLETIQQLYLTITPKSLGVADLGCSSGHNSLSIIKEMVDAIEEACHKGSRPVPEFRVHLNDLPTNDFNAIFTALPEFYREVRRERNDGGPPIYVAAYPGSFYGRLFPGECLHFIYSSYSLHWLSRSNRATVGLTVDRINPSIPQLVKEKPAVKDKVRQRVVPPALYDDQGRMGSDQVDRGNSFFWELLSRSLATLVSKGEVEEEKLDSYNVHFYAPSADELEDEVRREGSFEMDRLEMFEVDRDVGSITGYGTAVATTVRAIQEPMISHHFGEGIVDNLFEQYGKLVDEEMAKEEIRPVTFVVVLRKRM
ncbi:S-adenosyl-L-methionine-dependent methyltransferases superfamily protein [Actinidia rufa]|uniref:S-adenosyl-L-methionine-dependent methyltransferases superfamily protein n=1 Tax=Actinidia rufa TaxID=165716 RepID=A0A7J0E1S7_9ERIC|nr:S-adenosyl-L-methionine-dependent methyltransferases superfamily protein [Actinidia rufa]